MPNISDVLLGKLASVSGPVCDWATLKKFLEKNGLDTTGITAVEWMAKYKRICETEATKAQGGLKGASKQSARTYWRNATKTQPDNAGEKAPEISKDGFQHGLDHLLETNNPTASDPEKNMGSAALGIPSTDPNPLLVMIPDRLPNRALSQLAMEQILEDDFSDVED